MLVLLCEKITFFLSFYAVDLYQGTSISICSLYQNFYVAQMKLKLEENGKFFQSRHVSANLFIQQSNSLDESHLWYFN